MQHKKIGKVYLVGAGPGDPGLITVKAAELLKQADVVIYDYLVNEHLIKQVKAGAEVLYVGKQGKQHSLEQGSLNRLLVQKAKQGGMVVRLKGGDPFVFGRGGEEAEFLKKNRIAFEIVPGITSAVAAPAYAGIPLTHRDFAASVSIITGHRRKGEAIPLPDGDTLVYLMGVSNLPTIVKGLLQKGRLPKTPIALIRWGTRNKQATLISNLKEVVAAVKKQKFQAPAVIVIGKVVSLRQTLQWFEKKPLFAKRIVVTRSRQQASVLSEKLETLGADVYEFPTIATEPLTDYAALDKAIHFLSDYNYLIFTSQLGVKYFFDRLAGLGKDARSLSGVKIGCIGPATGAAVAEYGIKADFQASEYKAEGLLDQFEASLAGKKILIPRAAEAREVLPEGLKKRGARVNVVPVYRLVKPKSAVAEMRRKLKNKEIEIITFASSQTVRNFVELIGKKDKKYLKGVKIACIGQITAQTAREQGLKIAFEAKEYTMDGLVEAIVKGTKK